MQLSGQICICVAHVTGIEAPDAFVAERMAERVATGVSARHGIPVYWWSCGGEAEDVAAAKTPHSNYRKGFFCYTITIYYKNILFLNQFYLYNK